MMVEKRAVYSADETAVMKVAMMVALTVVEKVDLWVDKRAVR